MNPEEHHVALPKLYGAPAYARPPRVVGEIDRPPDPDDLPLEAFREDEPGGMSNPSPSVGENRGTNGGSRAASIAGPDAAHASRSASPEPQGAASGPTLEGRPFSVRALRRFLGGR